MESFNGEERGGEVGDLTMKLLAEWKDYHRKELFFQHKASGGRRGHSQASWTEQAQRRRQRHTVVRSDCLWAIAKYYNDGSVILKSNPIAMI